ncbi:MAG: hypothetical protein KGL39_47020 [Patescibacteria group bacterium]|nr:hypothetical protein [Patescibacteria group bacterium]
MLTQLASATGRNIAIFLQELHYVTRSQHKATWRGSYEYWRREHFPFWSLDTVERTISKAEQMGLVYSVVEKRQWYDRTKRTKSYGISYDAVAKVENQTGTLLLDDTPISFSSAVATLFSQTSGLALNDAFVLFEIRYWLKAEEKKYKQFNKTNTSDGSYWDLKRLNDFQKRLPFMSRRTVERSIRRLRETGYIKTEVTRWRTLAFTIVADKVNAIEGIAEELRVPEPPALTGTMKTRFYDDEYQVQGTNDLWYIVRSFEQISQDEYDGVLGLDDRQNVDYLTEAIAMEGKHELMNDLRSPDYADMFAEGDWHGYLMLVEDWVATTVQCPNCGERYEKGYRCVCDFDFDEELAVTG